MEEKPLLQFYDRAGTRDGKRNKCIPCHIKVSNASKFKKSPLEEREKWVKQKYGISALDYNIMLIDQNGCCYICGTNQKDLNVTLAIDHCHSTGKVRKLLCNLCNQGLGSFKDREDLLKKAIDYLKLHTQQQEG